MLENKPWMDIFLANNGGNLVEKVLDFGDDFIRKLDNKRKVSGIMFLSLGFRLKVCWSNSRITSRNIFSMTVGATLVLKLKVILCL